MVLNEFFHFFTQRPKKGQREKCESILEGQTTKGFRLSAMSHYCQVRYTCSSFQFDPYYPEKEVSMGTSS